MNKTLDKLYKTKIYGTMELAQADCDRLQNGDPDWHYKIAHHLSGYSILIYDESWDFVSCWGEVL